jgi:hypothetical protein
VAGGRVGAAAGLSAAAQGCGGPIAGSPLVMPTEPQPVTLRDVVFRAVDVCDESGVDAGLGELLERFEDADEPVGNPSVARARIDEALGALDPDASDGALQTAGAVAVYLAYRRDEVGDAPGELLRLAVRAEFDGDPPDPVAQFVAGAGVSW